MIGDIKGFCQLKSLDDVFIGVNEQTRPKWYEKVKKEISEAQWLRIIDIAVDDSGFLLLSPDGSCIVDVRNMNAVRSWFLCEALGEVLIPPDLNDTAKLLEMGRRMTRKGGYNPILRGMVILNSLRCGEFNDDFLFSKCDNTE